MEGPGTVTTYYAADACSGTEKLV